MRHNKSGRRLGRNSSHRRAMLRNMVTSLFEHEKITTTDARAKELRKLAEKMISLGKRGDLHARRQAAVVLQDRKVLAKLFDRIAPRYLERPGGYTRIIKLGLRDGDKAPLSMIELVEEELKAKPKKKAPAAKKSTKKEKPAEPEAVEKAPEVEETPVSEEARESVPEEKPAEPESGGEEAAEAPEEKPSEPVKEEEASEEEQKKKD